MPRASACGQFTHEQLENFLMTDLLQNPAVQAGVAPFVAAVTASAVLARSRLLALAQVAGFLAVVVLAIGLSFESLTATRKLVLVGLGTAVAALAVEWRGGIERSRVTRAVLLGLLAAGSTWMLWRLLVQKDATGAILAALLAAAYVVTLVDSTLRVAADPVRGAAAGLMLGLGTGAVAVLGASALLGFIGIAMGASAGATLLVQMLRGRTAAAGATISLPAGAISALAGVLAVATASLPWYCLLPLLAVPWAPYAVPVSLRPLWLRAGLTSLAALIPALAAGVLAWTTATGG